MRKAILVFISVFLLTIPVYGRCRIILSSCPELDTGEPLRNYIEITPDDTIPTGSVITIEFENAFVYTQDVIDGKGGQNDTGFKGTNSTYQYNGLKGEYKWNKKDSFWEAMPNTETSQVPYYINRVDGKKVEVLLCGIPGADVGRAVRHGSQDYGEPYYRIPLTAYVDDGSKEVKAKISGPANGFIRDTVIVVANENKAPVSNESTTVTEATTETTTTEQINKVSVKIGSDIIDVNDREFTLDAVPYIQQASSSTMIPLRAVSLALSNGYNGTGSVNIVLWDANTKTAIINYKGKRLDFTANANYVIADGEKITMDNGVYSEITEDRMFVPFRALGEAFGIEVNWDSSTWTATFN